jgi:hypothetical protein
MAWAYLKDKQKYNFKKDFEHGTKSKIPKKKNWI